MISRSARTRSSIACQGTPRAPLAPRRRRVCRLRPMSRARPPGRSSATVVLRGARRARACGPHAAARRPPPRGAGRARRSALRRGAPDRSGDRRSCVALALPSAASRRARPGARSTPATLEQRRGAVRRALALACLLARRSEAAGTPTTSPSRSRVYRWRWTSRPTRSTRRSTRRSARGSTASRACGCASSPPARRPTR